MKKKNLTLAELRKASEATTPSNSTTHLHTRRKVNSLCRCTPKTGIIAMHPDYARNVYDHELNHLLCSGNPGYIADRAIQIGDILHNSGRPQLALDLMNRALQHLLWTDFEMQEDYAHEHYWPLNPEYRQWYQSWSERVSETDARKLAAHIDQLQNEINRHLGHNDRSQLRFRIHAHYENEFGYIYET